MKRIIRLAIPILLLTMIIATNVYAYSVNIWALKFTTNQYDLEYSYQQHGLNNYNSAVQSAAGYWNSSSAALYLTKVTANTGENIVVESKNYGSTGWHGLCQPPIILAPNTSFIKANDYYYYQFYNDKVELISHEMGHSFCLNDIENDNVLMTKKGYKGSANPETDDLNGVAITYH